ncbi:hypothetical protein C8Q70DRAFT_193373 [Cubamyces menziesii]|nr:hypothetical protein C8Q70DRAFT_193373 [Cubamyces menziesii]
MNIRNGRMHATHLYTSHLSDHDIRQLWSRHMCTMCVSLDEDHGPGRHNVVILTRAAQSRTLPHSGCTDVVVERPSVPYACANIGNKHKHEQLHSSRASSSMAPFSLHSPALIAAQRLRLILAAGTGIPLAILETTTRGRYRSGPTPDTCTDNATRLPGGTHARARIGRPRIRQLQGARTAAAAETRPIALESALHPVTEAVILPRTSPACPVTRTSQVLVLSPLLPSIPPPSPTTTCQHQATRPYHRLRLLLRRRRTPHILRLRYNL